MPLKCTCPRCGRLHRNIDKRLLGKKFQCECGKVMRLGEAPKSSPTHQKAARTPQSAQANPQPATVSGKRSAGETPPANRSTRKRPAPNKPSVVPSADRSLLPREPELPQPPETGPADPAKVENAETQNPPQSTTPVDPGKPSGNLIGSEFDDVDELIQMGQLDTDLPVQPTVIADAVPTARPVSEPSTAEPVVLDELTVMPSEIISIEDDEASFEVLDDSDEDVIEILDSDLIVDPELAIKVADSGKFAGSHAPARNPPNRSSPSCWMRLATNAVHRRPRRAHPCHQRRLRAIPHTRRTVRLQRSIFPMNRWCPVRPVMSPRWVSDP